MTKFNITIPNPIRAVYGKNPLHWPRLFLLEMLLNGGIFANIVAWCVILIWVLSFVDLIVSIIEWVS